MNKISLRRQDGCRKIQLGVKRVNNPKIHEHPKLFLLQNFEMTSYRFISPLSITILKTNVLEWLSILRTYCISSSPTFQTSTCSMTACVVSGTPSPASPITFLAPSCKTIGTVTVTIDVCFWSVFKWFFTELCRKIPTNPNSKNNIRIRLLNLKTM